MEVVGCGGSGIVVSCRGELYKGKTIVNDCWLLINRIIHFRPSCPQIQLPKQIPPFIWYQSLAFLGIHGRDSCLCCNQ